MAERGMRVVVAGGGVAGASCAIALARIGAEVTVYEAYRDPAGPVGSFVSLAVNGLRALDVLGVLAPVQAAGFDVERHRMWSGRGKLLGDVPRGRRSGDSLHSVTLMRGDLVSILRDEATRSGVRIVTGHRLGRDFLGQARPDDADLVVGADGIWSETRRGLDPGAPEPAYAGLYSVSGISGEVPGVSRHARDYPGGPGPAEPSSWNMIFGRRGAFIYLPAPDGRIWWSAQVSAPRPPADLAAVTARRPGRGVPRRGARGGDPGRRAAGPRRDRAPRARPGAPPAHCRHRARRRRRAPGRRRPGSIDGARGRRGPSQPTAPRRPHRNTCFERHRRNSVSSALAAFDERRRGRAGKLAKTAASSNEAKTAGPVAARLRDMIMPVMVPRFYERATAWLYDYDPGQLPARRTTTGAA